MCEYGKRPISDDAVPQAQDADRKAGYLAADKGFDTDQFWETLLQSKQSLELTGCLEPFSSYRNVVERLLELPNSKLVPLRDLMVQSVPGEKRISLRFDVDMEPLTALRMARYNARFGVCGSFYLLHSAPYYGVPRDGVFCRSPLVSEWVRAFIVAGCELGLHTDPLGLALSHGMDGAEAVRTELEWLRSQGAAVTGTVAHNSFPAYGAENFEIFAGRAMGHRSEIVWDCGRSCALGVLDEAALGLTYEGNFPAVRATATSRAALRKVRKWEKKTPTDAVNNQGWMKTYLLQNPCFERAYEVRVWHHGGERWTLGARPRRGRKLWLWQGSLDRVLRLLARLPQGIAVVFHLHPIYFSRDTAQDYWDG